MPGRHATRPTALPGNLNGVTKWSVVTVRPCAGWDAAPAPQARRDRK